MPEDVLQGLAVLANVPAEQREFFFKSVLASVEAAWELDGLVKQGLTSTRSKTLASVALSLYETLSGLKRRDRTLIEGILSKAGSIFGRISSGGVDGLEQTAYQIARLFSLVIGKAPPRSPSQPWEPPGGRRLGTVKNWPYQNFVSELLISTSVAGGRLKLDKTPKTGSLIEALEKLTPYLPDGFEPNALSGSTFQRLQAECSRAEKQGDELDRHLSDDLP